MRCQADLERLDVASRQPLVDFLYAVRQQSLPPRSIHHPVRMRPDDVMRRLLLADGAHGPLRTVVRRIEIVELRRWSKRHGHEQAHDPN